MHGLCWHSFCCFDFELRVVVGVFHEGPTHEPVGEYFGDVFLAVVLENSDVECASVIIVIRVIHSALEWVSVYTVETTQLFEESP